MMTHMNRGLCGLGAAAGLLFLAGCSEPAPLPEPIIRPVRTQPVLVTGADRVRSFAGTAQAAMESRLSFKVAGTVERIAVAVGDRVQATQALASLQARDFQLQAQETEAQLASAEAQARNADANYARVRALYENRNASLNDLDAARAAAESATQTVKSVDKRLQLSRVQLGYTIAVEETHAAGTAIYQERDPAASMYQVITGRVRLHRGDLEINVAGDGDAFGTWALFDDEVRVSAATVVEDATVLRVGKDDFIDLLADNVEITQGVLKALVGRVRGLIGTLGAR